jgi:hypothetical protein
MPCFSLATVEPTVVKVTGTDSGSQDRMSSTATTAATGPGTVRKSR